MTMTLAPPDYAAFLAGLKDRILRARTSVARAINRDLILLYWDIGRGIVEKQQTAGWGQSVVERLAADLCADFPYMCGFSANNLWLMRQMYSEYSDTGFLEQLVQEMKKTGRSFLEQAVPDHIILYAEKDNVEVEFALKTKTNPIGVAEYRLQPKLPAKFKGRLPSEKQLAAAVQDLMAMEK